ncbi:MAG: hypothetical protein ABSA16_01760 [Thermoguttaceae bacterium]|jgi:hypothetical protein
MIATRAQGKLFGRHGGRSVLLTSALLAACLSLPHAGCGLLPTGAGNLPAKIGLRSKQAELREQVQADKFPTAKEAGL